PINRGIKVSPAAMHMVAVLDHAFSGADEFEQLFPTCQQRFATQIDAVMVQQIEGNEDDPIRRPSHRRPQRMEIRHAFLVKDDCLAIDDCRLRNGCRRLDNRLVRR
ncbi:hypothetical protein, partial [Mesorhizobium sp. M7A.F.Ca.MR.148.00.0.0]|uniref:hypothetical protein n=1 Tax=Mesorhizobium sp. M7A.F.Ca.MR.148.00.0.0 TaxID=2496775 RepID=UPI001FE0CCA7